MIKKINIINYGAYQNLYWNGDIDEFSRRNIIYGRNYSGKTTLSRIFRSIEKREHHEDFQEGKFEVFWEDGKIINDVQIGQSNLNIRVYNSDYKKENLSIFSNRNGDITPFTILGEKNIKVEKKINEANSKIFQHHEKIGNEKEKRGLVWEIKQLNDSIKKIENDLRNKMSKMASEIYRNNELFKWTENKKQYNRTDLEKEIITVVPTNKLDEEQRKEYKNIIKDEVKPLINFTDDKRVKIIFSETVKKTQNLLSKEIKPSKIIDYLYKNNELQNWVKEGAKLHKGKRDRCAFCQGKLDENMWRKIDAHFTKESEENKKQVKTTIDEVESQLEYWENTTLLNKDQFYSKFHESYNDIENEWYKLKIQQVNNLKHVLNKLKKKEEDVFSKVDLELEKIYDISDELKEISSKLDDIIRKNNEYTSNLEDEQNKARFELRMDEICVFMDIIDYKVQLKTISKRREERKKKIEEKDKYEENIKGLQEKIRRLEGQINDKQKAVNQINLYLKSFLGHPELSLELETQQENEKDKKTKFSIRRNSEPAYNLSEGEQSLIAFCYFLASLKDISNPDDCIIFVDDPISSLDGNNLFYVFSLIDSEIARKSYQQLFISTHNLDLLKYLYQIGRPAEGSNNKWKKRFYMLEKSSDLANNVTSYIANMPEYLKNYATEFTYLFNQISVVATEDQTDSNNHSFYNFPNIARKFLESYLFFKYPDHKLSNDERLEIFLGSSMESVSFINRINNEFSHGENQFDRLKKPIDIPEFKKDAQLILSKIFSNDRDQFDSLCNSIGLDREDLYKELFKTMELEKDSEPVY